MKCSAIALKPKHISFLTQSNLSGMFMTLNLFHHQAESAIMPEADSKVISNV